MHERSFKNKPRQKPPGHLGEALPRRPGPRVSAALDIHAVIIVSGAS
jgi:hypothetical protein